MEPSRKKPGEDSRYIFSDPVCCKYAKSRIRNVRLHYQKRAASPGFLTLYDVITVIWHASLQYIKKYIFVKKSEKGSTSIHLIGIYD